MDAINCMTILRVPSADWWLLGAECWVLSAECWLLSAECWVLSDKSWVLSVNYYKLNLLEVTKYSFYKCIANPHSMSLKKWLLSENRSQQLMATMYDCTKGDESYVLSADWWVPTTKCQVLSAECWVVSFQCWVLSAGYVKLNMLEITKWHAIGHTRLV